jgi:pseudoazurin
MRVSRSALAVLVSGLMAAATPALAADHEVHMKNQGADGTMVFEPGYLKVAPGDTVTFVPEDPAHNSHAVFTPDGADAWTGQLNEKVTVTLSKEGVYLYQCDPHMPLGMVGVIQVGGAGNLDAAKEKAETLSAGMAMNKGRFADYLGKVN